MIEQHFGMGVGGIPAMVAHLAIELAGAPAGIAESDQPAAWAPPGGDGPENVERGRQRAKPFDLDRLVAQPVGGMQYEAASPSSPGNRGRTE